jgi:hypothetical protein
MPTCQIVFEIRGGTRVTTGSVTKTGEAVIAKDIPLTAGQSNKRVTLDFLTADLTAGALIFSCDRDCTIESNSSSAPDNTWVVPAGGSVQVTSLAANITDLYVTNDDGANAATLKIDGVQDSTP